MYHIIYSSQANKTMTLTTLVVLLMQARALNERQQITGALVYGDRHFMQVMEGEETVVKELYERVAKDPRHVNVQKLAEGPIEARTFGQWTMAFGEVPAAEFQVLRTVAEYQTPEEITNQLNTHQATDGQLLSKMKEVVQAHSKG